MRTGALAAIYCRISDDRSGQGLGVERQWVDCQELADRLGLTVTADPYIDNDVSAFTGKRRKEYERLLGDIRAGKISAVITWHPKRLNRSPRELETLIELLERFRVRVHTVTAGDIDLSTSTGRTIARIAGALARGESEEMGERISRQKRQRALTGVPTLSGFRPFGYRKDRVRLNQREAALVREMVDRVLSDETPSSIATLFNRRGVATVSRGNGWRASTVVHIVTSPRIAGWRCVPTSAKDRIYYGHGFLVPGQWEAIVSRETVERVQALLKDETTRPGSSARWLLSRIALCGRCGLPLTSELRDKPDRRYKCDTATGSVKERCGRLSISWRLEQVVTDQLHQAVRDGLIQRVMAAGDAAWEPTVRSAEIAARKLASIAQDHDENLIDHAEWKRRRGSIERRSAADRTAAAEITTLDLSELTVDGFTKYWASATTGQRRTLLRGLAAEILVLPFSYGARQPDQRLRITWRA